MFQWHYNSLGIDLDMFLDAVLNANVYLMFPFRTLITSARDQWSLHHVAIAHRLGRVGVKEASVV